MRRYVAWVTLVGGIAFGACAPADQDGSPVSQRIEAIADGTFSAPGAHPAVVCLYIVSRGGCASGTLISPQVVLTAAHNTVDRPLSDMWVYFGNDAFIDADPAHWHHVVAAVNDPTSDIAVVRLDAPRAEPPLPLNTTPLENMEGLSTRLVGFGISAPGAFDAYYKREGTAPIIHVSSEPVVLADHSWPNKGYEIWLGADGFAHSLPGDSGAPVLAAPGGGQERVVGVIWGHQDDGSTSASRVDTVHSWLCDRMSELDPACHGGACCASTACDDGGAECAPADAAAESGSNPAEPPESGGITPGASASAAQGGSGCAMAAGSRFAGGFSLLAIALAFALTRSRRASKSPIAECRVNAPASRSSCWDHSTARTTFRREWRCDRARSLPASDLL